MSINLGSRVPFTDSFPAPYAKQPEKRWLCTRRSSFCRKKRVAFEALLLVLARLRTKAVLTVLHRNNPPWPRLDYRSQPTRFPEELAYTVLRALQRSMMLAWACMLKVEWTSPRHAMKHGRDRSRERARTQWMRMPLILNRNLKLLGRFIGNGEPPPPLPPCVRAWITEGTIHRARSKLNSAQLVDLECRLLTTRRWSTKRSLAHHGKKKEWRKSFSKLKKPKFPRCSVSKLLQTLLTAHTRIPVNVWNSQIWSWSRNVCQDDAPKCPQAHPVYPDLLCWVTPNKSARRGGAPQASYWSCSSSKGNYLTSVANRQRLPSYMGRRCESRRLSGSNPQPFAPKALH